MSRRGTTLRVVLSQDDFRELCLCADRRSMAPDLFLREVVHLMLRDRLVDAVIDDENSFRQSCPRYLPLQSYSGNSDEKSGAAVPTGNGGGPAQTDNA
jgi:hypothetical protein